jgi:hypothetical protein
MIAAILAALVAAGSVHFAGDVTEHAVPDESTATEIFRQLHARVYDALRAESEEEIYDALATALHGEALDETYKQRYMASLRQEDTVNGIRIRRIRPLSTEFSLHHLRTAALLPSVCVIDGEFTAL